MNIFRFIALVALSTLVGCIDTVSIDVPTGDRVAADQLQHLVGRWTDPDSLSRLDLR